MIRSSVNLDCFNYVFLRRRILSWVALMWWRTLGSSAS